MKLTPMRIIVIIWTTFGFLPISRIRLLLSVYQIIYTPIMRAALVTKSITAFSILPIWSIIPIPQRSTPNKIPAAMRRVIYCRLRIRHSGRIRKFFSVKSYCMIGPLIIVSILNLVKEIKTKAFYINTHLPSNNSNIYLFH